MCNRNSSRRRQVGKTVNFQPFLVCFHDDLDVVRPAQALHIELFNKEQFGFL